jgi:hypothetical protein
MKENSKVRKIAFVGNHLPRKLDSFSSDIVESRIGNLVGFYLRSSCQAKVTFMKSGPAGANVT